MARDSDPRLPYLAALEKKILWLSSWMIHNANHLRDNGDGVKVGGHQASSASLTTILTALYMAVLKPEDRVAVKPHASPAFHAIQYLLGRQTLDKIENFRGYKGAQSYPSRTKDGAMVDFSTGSVGLGVAQTLFASLVQDYVHAHGWAQGRPLGRMIALIGDAEMDEGNIFEALLEGWKQGLKNCWWIIDYNRQSLDAIVREGLFSRLEAIFQAFGWEVVIIKYGTLLEEAFAEEGGEKLRAWIEACPNALYSSLLFQGGAAWRKRLNDELGDQGPVSALIARRSDAELAQLMSNLGGHDLPTLLRTFESHGQERPTVFIAYTVKGFGLPLAGHKDNHAGMLTDTQMAAYRDANHVAAGSEWDKFAGLDFSPEEMQRYLDSVPYAADPVRKTPSTPVAIPANLPLPKSESSMSTQQGFGLILNEIGKSDAAYADRIVTTSPDVTVSTNLGGWVNRRKLFAQDEMKDLFRAEKIPSTFVWDFAKSGQHMELGIAEMNLFILLSALGLSHDLFGTRLLPIGTVYDPFIYRGLDALNYACYQDSRFLLVATPSGITLAGEGGAHQSIGTPLVGMAQDGLAAFEPAFIDELAVTMRFAFDYMQRSGDAEPDARSWLRDATGGAVYLRLSTRPMEQPSREMTAALERDIIDGAYWLRKPGPNAEAIIAYSGAIAPEAINAIGLLQEDRRDIGLLAVTSADRLNAGWTAAQRARERGVAHAMSHIERLLEGLPHTCGIVTVLDGHPATLGWIGAVLGHRTRSLGVEHFGQTGSLSELYRHYGIDTAAIIQAVAAVVPGRPIRHLSVMR